MLCSRPIVLFLSFVALTSSCGSNGSSSSQAGGGAGAAAAGSSGTAGATGSAGAAGSAGASGGAGASGVAGASGSAGASGVDAAIDGPRGSAGAGSDANPSDAPAADAAPPSGGPLPSKGLLTVYWGQNGWGATHNDQSTWEKPLADTCAAHPEYDVVILSFATQIAHTRNQPSGQSFVPELNFANHCETSYDADDPFLLKCDDIAAGVRACQAAGKKVLISIGGSTGSAGFQSDDDGKMAATSVWNIFLGGASTIRPFTNAPLDGVDLDIEGGGTIGYAAFATALRALMDASGHKYYITGAPQCPYPDAFLGPAAGRALGDAPAAFDFVWVQFYNNYCGYGTPSAFRDAFAQWKTLAAGGPKIVVGLPATTAAAGSGFVPRATLPALVGDVKDDPAFAGIMLWDASNDQNSAEGGTTYGAYAKSLLR
ncbi:MAG TPA: glycosyl hydrolase family 18 protein [Polyangia bacterium]|nr:glycosyl hydrolase family 18 protein [Polyangia bacterium]